MVTTYSPIGGTASPYAVSMVRIETEGGEIKTGFRVGDGLMIFADYPAAVRYADRKRAKDQAHAARLVDAKRKAAATIAAATQRAARAARVRNFGAGIEV
jgi:hypothetical protein